MTDKEKIIALEDRITKLEDELIAQFVIMKIVFKTCLPEEYLSMSENTHKSVGKRFRETIATNFPDRKENHLLNHTLELLEELMDLKKYS